MSDAARAPFLVLAKHASHLQVVPREPDNIGEDAKERPRRWFRRDLITGVNLLRVTERSQGVRECDTHAVGQVAQLRQVEIGTAVECLDDRTELRLRRHQPAKKRALAFVEQRHAGIERLRRQLLWKYFGEIRP